MRRLFTIWQLNKGHHDVCGKILEGSEPFWVKIIGAPGCLLLGDLSDLRGHRGQKKIFFSSISHIDGHFLLKQFFDSEKVLVRYVTILSRRVS